MKPISSFLLIFLIYGQGMFSQHLHRKDIPWDYYPELYGKLSAADWPRLKQTLDSALTNLDIENIRLSALRINCSYTFARIASIEWNAAQKVEVGQYLKDFYETLIQGRGYITAIPDLRVEQRHFPLSDPLFYPMKALWTLLFVDDEVASQIIESQWQQFLQAPERAYYRMFRRILLTGIHHRYASARIAQCLQTIQKQSAGQLIKDEEIRMENFTHKRTIFLLNDQRDAWNYLLNAPGTPDSPDSLGSKQVLHRWYRYNLLMRDVFQEVDRAIILDVVGQNAAPVKQYLLLYSACFHTNTKIYQEPVTLRDRALAARLDSLITAAYRRLPATVFTGQEQNDYLRSAYSRLSQRLEEN
ncbi:MAG: hypothetical protein ACE5GL_00130 [Calditrichia bacterium]